MNITRENIDNLTAVLTINIVKADYEEKVEKVLRDYRRKASIKGFRPGNVPMTMVKKMFGTSALVEEINKLVSDGLSDYITAEKLDILGDPIPKTDQEETPDFEKSDDFNFKFEIGLSPEIDITLSKKNKVTSYKIDIDDKMINEHIANHARRHGEFTRAETSEDKDTLKGDIKAGEETQGPEGANDVTLSVDVIKDEKIKKSFVGKKVGDVIEFDIRKAFPNDYEIAGLLKVKREETGDINGNYIFTVKQIDRFKNAAVDQELFDKVYGEGLVKSEAEFKSKVEEEIGASLAKESEYKLNLDLRDLAIKSIAFGLPEEFLKRWLKKVNEKVSPEEVEKEFNNFKDDLRWQLIRNKLAKENEIRISPEEMQQRAESLTRYQFAQYGLYYANEEQIAHYAQELLKREEDAKRIADNLLDEKTFAVIREMVKIEEKKIKSEAFSKLFE